jgi:hypothetical protein
MVDASDSVGILFSAALNLRVLLPRFSFGALNRKKIRDLRITRHREKEITIKLIGKDRV